MNKIKSPARTGPGKAKKKNTAPGDTEDRRQKKLEESLRESEQKFAMIFQNNAAAIGIARLSDGVILDVNEKFTELFARSRQELVGKSTARDILMWRDSEARKRVYRQLATRKSVRDLECELFKGNGEPCTVLLSSTVVRLHGEPVIISTLTDISERKRVAEENRSLAKFPSENPNPVLRLTPKSAIIYANKAARVLLGRRGGDREIALPAGLRKAVRVAFASGHARTIDFTINDRIFAFDILPIAGECYVNLYGRDETDHRRDEAALRASEHRYHSLFDKMSEGFALHEVLFDKKGVPVDSRFLEVNAAFEELSGQKREAVVGHRFTELLPKDDHRFIKVLAEVARTGKPIHFKDYLTTLEKHYDVTAFCPAPGQFAVLFTDVSEERKSQVELQKLNRTLKALSDSSQAMMQATDEAEFLKTICRIIIKDCGYRMAWIGFSENDKEKSVRPVAHAGCEKGYLRTLRLTWADRERGRGPTGTAIRTGKTVICPNMLADPRFAPWRSEARRRGFISSIALPMLADGQAFGVITIYSKEPDPFLKAEVELLQELAERLAFGIQALRLRQEHASAEEELQETSAFLEKLLNYANAPIVVWDPRLRIARFNHAFERLTGYAANQVIGKPLAMLFPSASKSKSLKLIRDTLEGRQWEVVEIPILQKNGGQRTILWNSANIQDKDGTVVATIAQGQDISERKRTEKLLQDSLEILRIAQSAAKAGMWSWDMVSGEITWSTEFFQLFGIDPAAGASFANWQAAMHPSDRETAMAGIQRAIEQRIPLENEYRIVLPGGEQRWISATGNTNYDKAGKPLRMSGICIDNSDRKRAEKQLEDSLHEKETLLRELYHRTKNNMNIISSLVALQAAPVSDLNMQRMFADMQGRIRAMSLVHEKLYQSHDLSKLDMRDYIGDLARAIVSGYRNSAARVALDLDIESVAFSIDAAIPCGLVINELLTNSLKYAFPEEMTGRIGISLRMSPGEEATLCYKDNGLGFPYGFDPQEATSLGLKMVRNLVKKQLLGTIEFIAVQGMRAVITFKKPVPSRREKP